MIHLSPQEILYLHHRLVASTGGTHSVRNVGLLESALAAAQQTFGGQPLHATKWDQAAALMRNLIQNHPFIDGNKRTAVSAAGIFLKMNGPALMAEQQELVAFTLRAAQKEISLEDIAAWFQAHATDQSA